MKEFGESDHVDCDFARRRVVGADVGLRCESEALGSASDPLLVEGCRRALLYTSISYRPIGGENVDNLRVEHENREVAS